MSPANTPVIALSAFRATFRQERRLCAQRHLSHLRPDGIAFKIAPGRPWISHHLPAVIAEHAFGTGQRGQDGLGPAAETGKEMRLDKACEDFDIRFQIRAVDAHRVTEMGVAKRHQLLVIPAIVLQTTIIVDNSIAEHGPQFGLGLGTVRAQAIEQGDVLPPDARCLQLGQDHRQDAVVGRGPSDVGVHDHHAVARLHQIDQRRTVDRLAQSLQQGRPFIGQAGDEGRGNDVGVVRDRNREPGAAVSEFNFHRFTFHVSLPERTGEFVSNDFIASHTI